MIEEQSAGTREAPAKDTSGKEGRLRVLQVAGGDPAFAAKLREMLWHEYRAAGCPLGTSEEAMFRWLMQEEQG